MNNTNTIKMGAGVPDTPLMLFQPFNFLVFLAFFSPVIVATIITSLSFIFQNFKGLIYLGFLIAMVLLRNYIYSYNNATPSKNDGSICTSIQYSKYGNPTFSAFVFAFTIMYLCLPMFSNNATNFWVVITLLVYFFLDMFIKLYKKCIIDTGELVVNILCGMASAALIITLMYAGGSGKFLFFNEVTSNKEMCYQPSEQTFKCNVYKGGELIGTI